MFLTQRGDLPTQNFAHLADLRLPVCEVSQLCLLVTNIALCPDEVDRPPVQSELTEFA